MWIADRWNDYEVLDTSGGEKLERWGKYRLVRPDPQVIWNTQKKASGWHRPNAHYHRSQKGGGEWEFFNLPEQWDIHYKLPESCFSSAGGSSAAEKGAALKAVSPDQVSGKRHSAASRAAAELTFHLKPFAFKHTGVFPEQAVNWDFSASLIAERIRQTGKAPKILNLFAYTGGATLAALAAGASVTHVDASKGMVGWAKENAASSGLSDAPVRWLVDDCTKFVEREIRRGSRYDAIIMDPPSYGRGPKGEIWKIEESVFPFIELCAKLLSDTPLFVLINSYTTGLQPAVLCYMLGLSFEKRFGGRTEAEEIGLPVTETGLVLPCGASGRWIA